MNSSPAVPHFRPPFFFLLKHNIQPWFFLPFPPWNSQNESAPLRIICLRPAPPPPLKILRVGTFESPSPLFPPLSEVGATSLQVVFSSLPFLSFPTEYLEGLFLRRCGEPAESTLPTIFSRFDTLPFPFPLLVPCQRGMVLRSSYSVAYLSFLGKMNGTPLIYLPSEDTSLRRQSSPPTPGLSVPSSPNLTKDPSFPSRPVMYWCSLSPSKHGESFFPLPIPNPTPQCPSSLRPAPATR